MRSSLLWSGVIARQGPQDRKSTRLNSSHSQISYAVFCLKKKKHVDLHYPLTPTARPAEAPAGRRINTRDIPHLPVRVPLCPRLLSTTAVYAYRDTVLVQ